MATITGTGSLAAQSASTFYQVPWTPADLGATVKLWLDASDASSFTIESGKVSQWNDKSGNSNHATQGTAGNRPTRTTDDLTVGAVDFGTFYASASGNYTGFPSRITGKTFAILWGSQAGGCWMFGDDTTYDWHRGASGYGANASDPIGDASYFALQSDTRKNAAAVTATSTGLSGTWDIVVVRSSGTPTAGTNALARDRIYRSGGMKIGAAIICDTVLSESDVQKLEGWMAWTFGKTTLLPSDHPYKNAAPLGASAVSAGRVLPIRITGNLGAEYAKIGGVAAFPSDVTASKVLWLDAQDSSTITLVSDKVSEWRDKSGVSHHASQATDANRPTVNNETGSFKTIDFGAFVASGAGKRLNLVSTSGKHFFIVLNSQNGGGWPFGHSTTYNWCRGNQGGGDYGQNYVDAWINTSYAPSYLYPANGAKYHLNGSTADPFTVGLSGNFDLVSHSLVPGNTDTIDRILSDRDAYRSGGARVAEIIVFSDNLSDSDREKIEGYLAHRYGIQSKLPSGHPWKAAPPGNYATLEIYTPVRVTLPYTTVTPQAKGATYSFGVGTSVPVDPATLPVASYSFPAYVGFIGSRVSATYEGHGPAPTVPSVVTPHVPPAVVFGARGPVASTGYSAVPPAASITIEANDIPVLDWTRPYKGVAPIWTISYYENRFSASLVSQSATMAGVGSKTGSISGNPNLLSGAATIAGVGSHGIKAVGYLAQNPPAAISGSGKHGRKVSGSLTSQAATIAGAGLRITTHTFSAAIVSRSATTAGSLKRGRGLSGALASQPATLAASGQRGSVGSGSLASQAAALYALGAVINSGAVGSGALVSQAAVVQGVGERVLRVVGSLTAGSAVVSGVAKRGHNAAPSLVSQAAHLNGSLKVNTTRTAAGSLVSQAATLSAAALVHAHRYGFGTLASQRPTTAASLKVNTTRTGTGALASGSATISATFFLAQQIFHVGGWGYCPTPAASGQSDLSVPMTGDMTAPSPRGSGAMTIPEAVEATVAGVGPSPAAVVDVSLNVTVVAALLSPSPSASGSLERASDVSITLVIRTPTPSGPNGYATFGDNITAPINGTMPTPQGSGDTFIPEAVSGEVYAQNPRPFGVGEAFFGSDITITAGNAKAPAPFGRGYHFAGTPIVATASLLRGPGSKAVGTAAFPPPVVATVIGIMPAARVTDSNLQVIGYTGIIPIVVIEYAGWYDPPMFPVNLKRPWDDGVLSTRISVDGYLRRMMNMGPLNISFQIEWEEATPNKLKVEAELEGTLRVRAKPTAGPLPITYSPPAVRWMRTFTLKGTITIIGAVSYKRFLVKALIRKTLFLSPLLEVKLPRFTAEPLTREYFNNKDDRRHPLPWMVTKECETADDVVVRTAGVNNWKVSRDRAFVMSSAYVTNTADPIADDGAAPGRIGIRYVRNGIDVVMFREPDENEIIYRTDIGKPMQWRAGAWHDVNTWPQTSLDAQNLTSREADPTGILRYYGMVIGLMMHEFGYDTAHLSTLIDPLNAPDSVLPLLAYSVGADYYDPATTEGRTPTPMLRVDIQERTILARYKGQPEAVARVLNVYGYRGYMMAGWKNPTTGAILYRPFGWSRTGDGEDGGAFPMSAVGIHIQRIDGASLTHLSPGTLVGLAYRLEAVLPAFITITYFATDIAVAPNADTVRVSDTLTITPV